MKQKKTPRALWTGSQALISKLFAVSTWKSQMRTKQNWFYQQVYSCRFGREKGFFFHSV